MAELIVLSFPDIGGAERCLNELLPLQHQHLIKLKDVACGAKKTDGKTHIAHLHPTTFEALLRGSLWGTLAGAIALEPFFGLLIGGTTALLMSTLRSNDDVISRTHIEKIVKTNLEPGQSALFLMVTKATPDKVMSRLYNHNATIVSTSLSTVREQQLRANWRKVRDGGPLSLQSEIAS